VDTDASNAMPGREPRLGDVAPPRDAWITAGGVGLAVRLAIFLASTGTNDIFTWLRFARSISASGICALYQSDIEFNHPPLAAFYGVGSLFVGELTGLPFHFVFKAVPLCADWLTALAVLRLARARFPAQASRVFCLYAWSPVPVLVSAYHGNTDALCVWLCMTALSLLATRSSALQAGVVLGLACNVKLVPVVLVPLACAWIRRPKAVLLFLSGASIGAIPFAWSLLACGPSAYTNVFSYVPWLETWGVPFVLILMSLADSTRGGMILEWYRGVGSLLTVAASALMSVRLKAVGVAYSIELGTIAFSLFLILAPGFGVQYLIYVTPFLMLTHPKVAVWFSASSGVCLVVVYVQHMTQTFPFESSHWHVPMPPLAAAIGFVSWAILVVNFVKSYVLPAGASSDARLRRARP
jgi:hypothetical protein